jgi:hypothetical protein
MTSKLRSKRIVIPTIAAAAVLGVGGTVWANSASAGPSDPDIDRASAAALAAVGEGKVTETETGDEEGAYEIEVTKDDGTQVDVHLDKNFKVISQDADSGDESDGQDDGQDDAGQQDDD